MAEINAARPDGLGHHCIVLLDILRYLYYHPITCGGLEGVPLIGAGCAATHEMQGAYAQLALQSAIDSSAGLLVSWEFCAQQLELLAFETPPLPGNDKVTTVDCMMIINAESMESNVSTARIGGFRDPLCAAVDCSEDDDGDQDPVCQVALRTQDGYGESAVFCSELSSFMTPEDSAISRTVIAVMMATSAHAIFKTPTIVPAGWTRAGGPHSLPERYIAYSVGLIIMVFKNVPITCNAEPLADQLRRIHTNGSSGGVPSSVVMASRLHFGRINL